MIYKILNSVLNIAIKRWLFMLLCLVSITFSCYCLKALFGFIIVYNTSSPELINGMSETLNGIADVLVGLGVLFECREQIMKMMKKPITEEEEYLNMVAEHDGIGILILGLFMEIMTVMIKVPSAIVDTTGIEIYLFYVCFFFILCAIAIKIDLIKDYLLTYFKKHQEKMEEAEEIHDPLGTEIKERDYTGKKFPIQLTEDVMCKTEDLQKELHVWVNTMTDDDRMKKMEYQDLSLIFLLTKISDMQIEINNLKQNKSQA